MERALAPKRTRYWVCRVPTLKTKTSSLKLERAVGLFLVISNACVDEGGGGWWLGLLFLFIFKISLLLQIDVLMVVPSDAQRPPVLSLERPPRAETCSGDYESSRNTQMKTGKEK